MTVNSRPEAFWVGLDTARDIKIRSHRIWLVISYNTYNTTEVGQQGCTNRKKEKDCLI